MQNFELISFATADELARAVAGAWLDEIEAAHRAGKPHCVALSGGRITQKFFASVVEQAKARKIGDGGTPSLPATSIFSGRTSAAFRQTTRKAISPWPTNSCSRR